MAKMLKVVGDDDNVEALMKKHKIRDKDIECLNCGKPAVYNECFYIKGYAAVRFRHDCPEKYWITTLVPIAQKEKDFWSTII